ncbi:hypothetical protein [Saccharothrix algeriensis]|uniref:Uncharacterized protein n=1 Tax=Saccharothrix algeriensis TaxID=173560 RepID=A0ABS2S829_9PSEU|nr:hypothetical protein [Saccharothrix algeriensis]MBM7811226.1 hypothetical protein [Saccharothrix algeriensis]
MGNKTEDSLRSWAARNRRSVWVLGALVAYVLAVGANLLVRSALHGWAWHDGMLRSSLIMSVGAPLAALVIPLAERRREG